MHIFRLALAVLAFGVSNLTLSAQTGVVPKIETTS